MNKIKCIFGGMIASIMLSAASVPAIAGQWLQGSYGWWYQNYDGSYPKNGMYTIDGVDYIFDKHGWMLENQWYQTDNGYWYYTLGSGEIAKNRWIGDYYLGSDGRMLRNTWTPDGYYVDDTGKWDPNATKDTKDTGQFSGGAESGSVKKYYTIDGTWDNRDQGGFNATRRVDMNIDLDPGDEYSAKINFGLYQTTGTTYSLYDSTNPNGDILNMATPDGLEWGGRSQISDKWYTLVYNGSDTITLYWRETTWGPSNGILVFKRRSGGTYKSNWTDGSIDYGLPGSVG